ncbi:hypothetical protein [Actinomyces lilanjuaniae]|uniref:hypothetical protein n=1 Tax=Actinomyces lilanjuaniae TaxID=2321394 RepID=UPI0013C468AD|nr:hypothetical protein [Actinomyces lilanjuaniae]
MGDIPSWISVVIAAACAVGSLIGWWGSRKSEAEAQRIAERSAAALEAQVSQGRASAEQAAQAVEVAEEHAGAAARSAAASEKIAAALTPPPLVIEWSSRNSFWLRNTSDSPVEVEAFTDPDAFLREPFDVPVTLAAGESVSGDVTEAWGLPFPGTLSLRVAGKKSPVTVPLSGRPPKS